MRFQTQWRRLQLQALTGGFAAKMMLTWSLPPPSVSVRQSHGDCQRVYARNAAAEF